MSYFFLLIINYMLLTFTLLNVTEKRTLKVFKIGFTLANVRVEIFICMYSFRFNVCLTRESRLRTISNMVLIVSTSNAMWTFLCTHRCALCTCVVHAAAPMWMLWEPRQIVIRYFIQISCIKKSVLWVGIMT